MGMCKHCGKTTYLTHLHSCEIKPKKWQGLSDEEIEKVFKEVSEPLGKKELYEIHTFAKAIEQKLKEKNT